MVGFAALFEFFRGCLRPGGEFRVGEVGERCGDVEVLILIGLVVDFVKTGLVGFDSCLMEGDACGFLDRGPLRYASPALSLSGDPMAC